MVCCAARRASTLTVKGGGRDGASCRPEPLEAINGLGATVFDNPEYPLHKLTHHHVMFALHRDAYDVGVGDRFDGLLKFKYRFSLHYLEAFYFKFCCRLIVFSYIKTHPIYFCLHFISMSK